MDSRSWQHSAEPAEAPKKRSSLYAAISLGIGLYEPSFFVDIMLRSSLNATSLPRGLVYRCVSFDTSELPGPTSLVRTRFGEFRMGWQLLPNFEAQKGRVQQSKGSESTYTCEGSACPDSSLATRYKLQSAHRHVIIHRVCPGCPGGHCPGWQLSVHFISGITVGIIAGCMERDRGCAGNLGIRQDL